MESITKNRQSKEIIIKMMQKAFGSNINCDNILIRELTEGFFNVAYDIKLPDREVILKIAPPLTLNIMSYEKNIMKAEVDGLRLINERTGVPVPEVFYYDDTKSICNADYFIMEKLEGESFFSLNNNGLPQDKQMLLMKQIGSLNREMNQITGYSFGYLGQPEKQGANWKETFLSMIADILSDGEKIKINLGVEYDEVSRLIETAAFALESITTPVFVHGDLWHGNVFVNAAKITGIIDFERALWGDPLMEYFFRRHSYNEQFIKGYGRDLRAEAPVRALLYDIYLYLIMVIETRYRNFSDDGQYNFAVRELRESVEELSNLVY